jgi:hypothetical protein
MSLTAFKKKSVIQYGSRRSGKPPGGVWLPQGPFGSYSIPLEEAIKHPGPVGFSLNGGHRNVGYVGKESKFSKNGTPFRGLHPMGWGGHYGHYARTEPVYNVNEVIVLGDQAEFVKPSVLSTYGMLQKKYRWAYNGQYPNYWVQPVYGNTTQSDTASQGMYLHDKTVANICVTDINNYAKYVGYIKNGGPTLCSTTTARFRYNDMARNAPYTKELRIAETSSQHTLRIQRRCANPLPYQKPFPYKVQTGTGVLRGGISVNRVASACGTQPTYNVPPQWYLAANSVVV